MPGSAHFAPDSCREPSIRDFGDGFGNHRRTKSGRGLPPGTIPFFLGRVVCAQSTCPRWVEAGAKCSGSFRLERPIPRMVWRVWPLSTSRRSYASTGVPQRFGIMRHFYRLHNLPPPRKNIYRRGADLKHKFRFMHRAGMRNLPTTSSIDAPPTRPSYVLTRICVSFLDSFRPWHRFIHYDCAISLRMMSSDKTVTHYHRQDRSDGTSKRFGFKGRLIIWSLTELLPTRTCTHHADMPQIRSCLWKLMGANQSSKSTAMVCCTLK